MKKIFIISAVLLVVVLIFLGVYNFAFKKSAPTNQSASSEPVKEIVKNVAVIAKQEKIKAISDGAVLGPVVDKKTAAIKYYDALTGIVWRVDADAQSKQPITETKVMSLKSVLWSPEQGKAITMMQKDGKTAFYMYDYTAQKGTALKENLDTVVWDNLGTKIFYKYFDAATKERTLNIANPDGSGWQKITDITDRKLVIAPVPLTSLVSFWNYPNNEEETHLQTVGVTGGEAKIILAGKYGADYLWSPDGSKALVSSLLNKEDKKITLGLVTLDGNYQNLNIPTLVSKSVWSADNKTVYYTLPGGIPTEAVMPNSYQENKFNTEDTFWKMDIVTGEKKRIIEAGDINGKYDASSMFLSATEDALYFVNRVDQKLYKISL